jgi:alpha-L-rhamnosidase
VSDWKRTEKEFSLKVMIPPNTTATVYVPAKTIEDVTVNGETTWQAVAYPRLDNGRVVFSMPSGEYTFKCKQ